MLEWRDKSTILRGKVQVCEGQGGEFGNLLFASRERASRYQANKSLDAALLERYLLLELRVRFLVADGA